MGKLGNQPLRGENKRPSPTAHRTAIFSHSQGARIEGTKPSVLDRLPCWGAGRQLGERSGEAEGGGRPASGSCPSAALSVKAGGRQETGPCGAGAGRAQAQDRPSPDGARGCGRVFWGRTRLCRRDSGHGPGGGWCPQKRAAGWFLPLSQAAHEEGPHCCLAPWQLLTGPAPRQRPEQPGGGAERGQELSLSEDRDQVPEQRLFSGPDQREREGESVAVLKVWSAGLWGSRDPFVILLRCNLPFLLW